MRKKLAYTNEGFRLRDVNLKSILINSAACLPRLYVSLLKDFLENPSRFLITLSRDFAKGTNDFVKGIVLRGVSKSSLKDNSL